MERFVDTVVMEGTRALLVGAGMIIVSAVVKAAVLYLIHGLV